MPEPKRVFISYSHEDKEHENHAIHDARVLAFADSLNANGFLAAIDQYVDNPSETWELWMERQIHKSDFVLLICNETYHRRFYQTEKDGVGLGARWEGHIMRHLLYQQAGSNDKFIPVLFPDGADSHIPTPIAGYTHYRITLPDLSDNGYERLIRRLSNQPATPAPVVSTVPNLPPTPRGTPTPT
ncbi:MAG: toll/interleukin-1 receptor domain-containing protein [Armatimonadetes bacterium]|nr:toll/interleukin-1 receptor domain-containing protein [Armatimonadota bacterium]